MAERPLPIAEPADVHFTINTTTAATEVNAGLHLFKNEQYHLAADAFRKALTLEPGNEYCQQMLELSEANHFCEVQIPVPDIYYFEREMLLRNPSIEPGSCARSTLMPSGKPGEEARNFPLSV